MKMPLNKISELEMIKRIARKVTNDSSVVCGIGDDAAVLKYDKTRYLLFTADMLVEEVDFTSKVRPEELGHKAIACCLSDIAAMGGWPKYSLISIGMPVCWTGRPGKNPLKFIDGFYQGALKLARRFKTNVVGGDLGFSKKIVIDVSTVGEVKKENLALRSGAKPGDIIFVSGSLGGSIYGRHLKFIPRLEEANYLVSNYRVHSMMDISDGLSLDLHRLCRASNVGAVIYENLIPVSKQAKSAGEALNMGEDFELLFTLSGQEAKRLGKNCGRTFTAIGEIRQAGCGIKLITRDYKEKLLEPKGYQHF